MLNIRDAERIIAEGMSWHRTVQDAAAVDAILDEREAVTVLPWDTPNSYAARDMSSFLAAYRQMMGLPPTEVPQKKFIVKDSFNR
jgi:hypothetical protein